VSVDLLPGQPAESGEPVFREPWEAQAFAMTISLYESGVFTWSEWAETLSAEITKAQQAGDPDLGDTYYHHWLAALETIVAAKGACDDHEQAAYQDAWRHAAARTLHGRPITLTATDFPASRRGSDSLRDR
jgi:nitrile hydratase accessory protein